MIDLLRPIMTETYLALAGLFLIVFTAFMPEEKPKNLCHIAMAGLVGALIVTLFGENQSLVGLNGLVRMSQLSIFMKTLILGGSIGALALSIPFLKDYGLNRAEYPILMLFATLGMLVMVSANDLITVYLGLELQSLCLYVLAAFCRDSLKSTESAVKYFVLGALASALLLYGISLIYGFVGTTNFQMLADAFKLQPPGTSVLVGISLVLVALAFKISLAPFHMWTPDVYEGVPTPVTAFFAAVPKIAALGLILNLVLFPLEPMAAQWQGVLMALGLLSIVVGALSALFQTHIRRLLAYSAIGHMGYVILGVAVLPVLPSGSNAVLVYAVVYLLTTLGVFGCLLSLRLSGVPVDDLEHLKGLSKTHPRTSLCLAIFMFSLAGIPPLGGFFGKLYIFMSLIEAGFLGVAVAAILGSVIAAYYYLRVVKYIYFDEPQERLDVITTPMVGTIVIGTSVFMVFFAVFQIPILYYANLVIAEIFGA